MQLSVKDTAKILNVSEKTIYRWVKQQILPVYRINEQYRFNRSELLDWATSRRIQISPEIFQETDQSKTPLPSLSDALKVGGISYRIGGKDKPSVLRSIVDTLNLPEEVDREFLYQVLMARETLGSTGIGDGIAIPHVRNPVVLHISKPSITLCFLDHPIDFRAIDGQPVDTLFTLVSPTVRAHLHILSRLGFVLQNKNFRTAIKQQASRENLIETLSRAESAIPVMNTADKETNGNVH